MYIIPFLKNIFSSKKKTTQFTYEATPSYEVRWTSRYGEYSGHTRPEIEIFKDKNEAEHFKKMLEDAFKIIKHTSGDKVSIIKR